MRSLSVWRRVTQVLIPCVVVSTMGVALAGTVPDIASAGGLCTDSWVGPSEGAWRTAADWSSGKVPSSSDTVCIAKGHTVVINEGTEHAGVLQVEGALSITGGSLERGSLEVSSSLERSVVSTLSLAGGRLTGVAEIEITGSLSGGGGAALSYLETSGSFIIAKGANATMNSAPALYIVKSSVVNEGTITVPPYGVVVGSGEATLINKATIIDNGQEEESNGLLRESGGATLVNSGTIKKTEGTRSTHIGWAIKNDGLISIETGGAVFNGGGTSGEEKAGSWSASPGASITFDSGSFALGSKVPLSGFFYVLDSATVSTGSIEGSKASVAIWTTGCCSPGKLEVNGASPSTLEWLLMEGILAGTGEVDITKTFIGGGRSGARMEGAGKTVIESGAVGEEQVGADLRVSERALINDGQFSIPLSEAGIDGVKNTTIINNGTFTVNSQGTTVGLYAEEGSQHALFRNNGTVKKTEGTGVTHIGYAFENYGTITEVTGTIEVLNPLYAETETQFGELSPSMLDKLRSLCGDPVNCVSGNDTEAQTDLSVGGRGLGVQLTRTYNAQAAAKATGAGMFGYGWSSTYSDHLVGESSAHRVTLVEASGGTVPFTETETKTFEAPQWTQDTLTGSKEAGYTLTYASQTKFAFSGSGRLESETDRNGNKLSFTYNGEGRLERVSDPFKREITFKYNAEGQVESAKDPMGHVVKYAYEGGNLVSVTLPGETSPNWRFKYDGSHRMTLMINGLGGETSNVYDSSNRVTSQKDPLGHTLKFEYEAFQTKITNEATGAVTLERYDSGDRITSVTNGYGTASATTKKVVYNERGEPTSITDGDGHTTTFEYNGAGDRTKLVTPEGHETTWTYNGTHDVMSVKRPNGEETTIERDEHGNPTKISRPAPKSTTQETKFEYANGQVTKMTDPLGRKWTYAYDAHGDLESETDPEGDKRTWTYDEDSRETSTVSPRGNVTGGKPTEYTTKIELDEQGRPIKITDPLGHETHYGYDADGNRSSVKDADGHETKTTFNVANEPVKVTEASGAITEAEYDGAGQVIAQIDGNKKTTKYVRNVLEQVTEVIDPISRKTKKTYDAAGNLETVTDPEGRTTTYTYNKDNELTKIAYSEEHTHGVEYEYNADGDRTTMIDGSGKTTYTYDQLDRLTKVEDGHKDLTGYEYDLANEQTKITYPNGKSVERLYDSAGRLKSTTDWLGDKVKFTYNADSYLNKVAFPSATAEEDTYAYSTADSISEIKMKKSTETLASFVYTRGNDFEVKKTVAKGVPGAETAEYAYDENERLTKAGTEKYEYDPANNPTLLPGSSNTFDAADELTEGTGVKYSYDKLGERIKRTPSTGPATTYSYDQAGDLVSVARPAEGSTPKIEDSYAYSGDGLRMSQTVEGKTSYLAIDPSGELPLIINDGVNNYIYGPGGLPVEQINNATEKVQCLHHDQAGSTRLITGSTGTVEGAYTYTLYGGLEGHTGTATTPLGYDGQYTNSDTGLVYLRARSYDPATAQFMSVDAVAQLTLEPYSYANDNPLNLSDPSGLLFGIPGTPTTNEIVASVEKGAEKAANKTAEAVSTVGESVNNVAHAAAPAIDGVAAAGCVAAAEVCGTILVTNFLVQQFLAVDQSIYNPNYNFGLNEAAIIGGAGLGTLGAGVVDLANLRLIGRLALGGSIAAPQWLLNLFQLLSPEEAAALLGCQQ